MKEKFLKYLGKIGYKQTTPSGNPSTAYDYANRVDKIRIIENITWQDLSENIKKYLEIYDKGGLKENEGKKSHNAVINALKRFSEFSETIHSV